MSTRPVIDLDLSTTPFSRRGSYFAVSRVREHGSGGLFLRTVRGDAHHREVLRISVGGSPDPSATTTLKDLFASWSKWCEEHGEHAGSSRALADVLEEEFDFPRTRKGKGARSHVGIRRVIV